MSDESLPKSLRALNVGTNNDPEKNRETFRGAGADSGPPSEGEEDTVRGPTSGLAMLNGDPVIGTEVSGYLVKGRLGQGGMGIVYEGEQPLIGKRVAIKVLRPEVAEDPSVVKRLVAEARAVNQVGHRGIIDVFGFGQLPDGRHCMLMEYLEGESLEHMIGSLRNEHRIMPILETLNILDELLSALGAAHSAGVIHRDLKPSNIFLCKQRDGTRYVKVLDFGIAKLGVVGATPQTNASVMVGTPAYMAPEQARGGMVSPALDLYAVGCIAYELLTGQQPFSANSVVEMIMKHQDEVPPRPSERVLSLPDLMDDFVMKLLQKKPADRYGSADEARKVISPLRKELSKSSARMPELAPKVSLSPSLQLEAFKVAEALGNQPTPVAPNLNETNTQVSVVESKPSSKLGYVVVFLLIAVIAAAAVIAFGKKDEPLDKVIVPVAPTPSKPLEPEQPSPVVPTPIPDAPKAEALPPVTDPPQAEVKAEPAAEVKPEPVADVKPAPPAPEVPAKPDDAVVKTPTPKPTVKPEVQRLQSLLARVARLEKRLAKSDDDQLKTMAAKVKTAAAAEAKKPVPSVETLGSLEALLADMESQTK